MCASRPGRPDEREVQARAELREGDVFGDETPAHPHRVGLGLQQSAFQLGVVEVGDALRRLAERNGLVSWRTNIARRSASVCRAMVVMPQPYSAFNSRTPESGVPRPHPVLTTAIRFGTAGCCTADRPNWSTTGARGMDPIGGRDVEALSTPTVRAALENSDAGGRDEDQLERGEGRGGEGVG